MTRIALLAALVALGGTAQASASGFGFNLPHVTFTDTAPATAAPASQGCASPAIGASACALRR